MRNGGFINHEAFAVGFVCLGIAGVVLGLAYKRGSGWLALLGALFFVMALIVQWGNLVSTLGRRRRAGQNPTKKDSNDAHDR